MAPSYGAPVIDVTVNVTDDTLPFSPPLVIVQTLVEPPVEHDPPPLAPFDQFPLTVTFVAAASSESSTVKVTARDLEGVGGGHAGERMTWRRAA